MTKLARIIRQVSQLDNNELATFRAWFSEFDATQWDRQFEADAVSGRLDSIADAALAHHAARRRAPSPDGE